MADQSDLAADLLTGGGNICVEVYGNKDKATLRRFYYEVSCGRWPVFRLDNDTHGVFYALRSQIRAHLEAKRAEHAAKVLAAKKAAAAQKTARPKPRRRRRPRSPAKDRAAAAAA